MTRTNESIYFWVSNVGLLFSVKITISNFEMYEQAGSTIPYQFPRPLPGTPDEITSNIYDALVRDYGGNEYCTFSKDDSSGFLQIKITSKFYDLTGFAITSIDPASISHFITSRNTYPGINNIFITGQNTSIAPAGLDPNVYVKYNFTADLNQDAYPVDILRPVKFTALTEAGLRIYYKRHSTPVPVVELEDKYGRKGSTLLQQVTVWKIRDVDFYFTDVSLINATVEIEKIHHGEIDPVLEFSADGNTWQDSNIFVGLTSFVSITFYAREKTPALGGNDSIEKLMGKSRFVFKPEEKLIPAIAVHSDLPYFIDRDNILGAHPDFLTVSIESPINVVVGSLRAYQHSVPNQYKVRYMFDPGSFLRSLLPNLDDTYTAEFNTPELVPNIYKDVRMIPDATPSERITIIAGARNSNEDREMLDVYENREERYVLVEGQPGYIYFYSQTDGLDNSISRVKTKYSVPGLNAYTGFPAMKIVNVLPRCKDSRVVKYMDRNGMYRFYAFNGKWKLSGSPKLIGKVASPQNALRNPGKSSSIGYRNSNKIQLYGDFIEAVDMVRLSDIYTSPRVYLHVGEPGTDGAGDWVECEVSGGDNILKRGSRDFYSMKLELTLPEEFTQTML